ncbi:MAG: hypothetical protein ACTSSP_10100 [Candidatus Asgardarchaeia archaeon]
MSQSKEIKSLVPYRITTFGYYGGIFILFMIVVQIPISIIQLQNTVALMSNTTEPILLNLYQRMYDIFYTSIIASIISLLGLLVGFVTGKHDLNKFIQNNEKFTFKNIIELILGLKYALLWVIVFIVAVITSSLCSISILPADMVYEHIFIVRLLQSLPFGIMLASIVTYFYNFRKFEAKNGKVIKLFFGKDQIVISTVKI